MIFVFPGQGSQYLGMGRDLYNNFSVAKLVFEEIDEAIKFNLSHIIFNGTQEELNKTEYTQPAIMAVSIAVTKVLEHECGKSITTMAEYIMGHSLGEYSALCAVNALSIADTANLLRIRGKAMQEAVPIGEGSMLALLGSKIEEVENLAQKIRNCEIANDNGGGQIVLSCLVEQVEHISNEAKKIGVKRIVQLPVSAPFHSSFMQPAAKKVQEALKNIDIKPLSVPLIANATANKVTEPKKIRESLVQQITSRVRWRESILICSKSTHYVELGPGNVLSNLIKKIDKSSTTDSICSTTTLQNFLIKRFA